MASLDKQHVVMQPFNDETNHTISVPRFQRFSVELLEMIFHSSENVNLPLVCRHFHNSLSTEPLRLQNYTSFLARGATAIQKALVELRSEVLRRVWFAPWQKELAKEVIAILDSHIWRARTCDYTSVFEAESRVELEIHDIMMRRLVPLYEGQTCDENYGCLGGGVHHAGDRSGVDE
ncbi:hypothetical protein MMC12_003765 [Toensbergia leucococca]|nr:hypothetical protein [Toensbergia leucococca]